MPNDEAIAAADKEMEERANRAKALLSKRYVGLKHQQVSTRNGLLLSFHAIAGRVLILSNGFQ